MLTNLRVYLRKTYSPARGSNSVGQSSVLIKRRSRVQVPPAPPISCELTDEQLENVIGGASGETFNLWRLEMINEGNKNAAPLE